MKKTLFALALAGLVAGTASADSNFGVKIGSLSVDGDDSAATQIGLVYTWDLVGMFGVEGEINTSLADGEFAGVDYGVTQFGAYGVVMSPGALYFKGKAGMVYSDFDYPGAETSSDLAYGVGLGFELIGFVWEVEYTLISGDDGDATMLSLGFKF